MRDEPTRQGAVLAFLKPSAHWLFALSIYLRDSSLDS